MSSTMPMAAVSREPRSEDIVPVQASDALTFTADVHQE